MAWERKHSGSAQTVCPETQSLPLRNQPTGLKTWEQSCMEVSASRLAQIICFHDRFSLAGDGRCPFETTESVNKHKNQMTKKDYIEAIIITSAVMLLGCCLFILGTLKGKEMMYIQAIANGAGTYNEEGEFKWIKN